MYTRLGRETLTSGETLDIGVVAGPDTEWQPRIQPFLGHKGAGWNDHIQRALEGPLDALETLFYVGCIGEELVTHVMIVGNAGAGILGHVFTHPGHRRKGAYRHLMAYQMEDMPRRGYRALTLGTGYDRHPYWIYHSFGFRGIREGSGQMKWEAEPGAEVSLLAPAATSVRPVEWTDWGAFALLATQPVTPGESLPRSLAMGVLGQGNLEFGFIQFKLELERNRRSRAVALVTESRLAVGWASVRPDARWFGQHLLVDVYTHPHFEAEMPRLLAALDLGAEPAAAYVNAGGAARRAALESAEFAHVALLPQWLRCEGERHDVEVWTRETGAA